MDRDFIETILRRAPVCRVGLWDGEGPHVVPMDFGYEDNKIFLYTKRDIKSIDLLKKNHIICFEIDVEAEIKTIDAACHYESKSKAVIGFGKTNMISDGFEKKRALNVLIRKYYGPKVDARHIERELDEGVVVQVDIDQVSSRSPAGEGELPTI